MIDRFKYRWQLNRLLHKRKKTERYYDKLLKNAKKEGQKRDEIEALRQEAGSEYFDIQDEIDLLITSNLLRVAEKLILPIPKSDNAEMWEESRYFSRKVLTKKGVAKLRTAIRDERKDKRDAYLPWIAGLTGLIGAITGLLAVILR